MPINQAALDHFMSWEGPVGRSFKTRIDLFEAAVRTDIPIRYGRLEESIGHELLKDGKNLAAHIGANPTEHRRGYAIIVHQGSRSHVILPHKPPKSLRFHVAGRIVYAQRVFHPGTVPDPFLTRWIRELTK